MSIISITVTAGIPPTVLIQRLSVLTGIYTPVKSPAVFTAISARMPERADVTALLKGLRLFLTA